MWILGASDPEMRGIEAMLQRIGLPFQYATKDGKPVHPGNAYQADAVNEVFDHIVLVECEPVSLPVNTEIVRIDHHKPGDAGYDLPPDRFWEASSIGQAYLQSHQSQEMCDYDPHTQDMRVLAAMDHCPAAAIRGECPGVTDDEVLERKVAEIAAATKLDTQVVADRVEQFRNELSQTWSVEIGGQQVKDLRSIDLGSSYMDIASAQTAALRDGYTVLLKHAERDGAKKVSISGHASPECVRAFMEEYGPAQGLSRIYGVPSRGYAGGYI